MNYEDEYVLVTDGIIEMNCVANSYKEAANLFLKYLKNQNDDCIYEFDTYEYEYAGHMLKLCKFYEYNGNMLNTVHFILSKHYIDFLRSRQ